MRTTPRRLTPVVLLLAAALVGSCVGGEDPTAVRTADVGIALQPALIPSAADGTALPVNSIRTIVVRQPDGVVLREQRFTVSPTAPSWTLDVTVPVTGDGVDVIVYLYLLNVDDAGVETVQFSGRTDLITVEAGARVTNVDADVVRGPPTNLLVTSVSITSSPDTVYVDETGDFAASVETSEPTTVELFWTSLDPDVLTMDDSVGTGEAVGTAQVVASAGAFADTVSVVVITAAVDSVRVLPDSADVQVGLTRTYVATLFDVNGNAVVRPVTWTTGSTSIATVNASTGVVTGVAAGTTTVRATSEGVFDEAMVRVTSAPTGGGTNSWIATNGSWSTGANWSLGRPPAPADTVTITQGTGYTVTLDVSDTIAKIVVGDGVRLSMGANSLTMTGIGNGPELEIQATGTLETTTGAVFARGIQNAGTVRTLGVTTITADSIRNTGEWRADEGVQIWGLLAGPWFETDSLLYVGPSSAIQANVGAALHYGGGTLEGTGLLTIVQGSLTLSQHLVFDSMLVALQSSSIFVADAEDLTIGPGALVNLFSSATEQADIQAGSVTVQGALYVTGPRSQVSAPLQVEESGVVSVVATGAPATLGTQSIDNAGTIILGGDQEITLGPGEAGTIWNRVTGLIEVIPFAGTHRAILNGELLNDGEMLIAGRTTLIREDADGNPVSVEHTNSVDATITLLEGGDVHIALGGSSPKFTNSGTITVYEGATLSVENLAAPTAGQIIASPTAVFEGSGAVDLRGGPPTYPPLGGFNDGTISPGLFGPGIMTWLGTVPMAPSGDIAIDIDGPTAGTEYDRLDISAQLYLIAGGTLDLNWGYSPFMGDRFAIISYGERIGNFGTVNLNTPSGISLDTLTVVTTSTSVPDTFVVVVTDGPSPPQQIAGDWPFDEGAGQIVLDDLGQGNHGTLGGDAGIGAADPTWLATGRVGSALTFNGAQVVRMLDHATLQPSQVTVEAFVRSTNTGQINRYIVSKGGGPGGFANAAYAIYTSGTGGLQFYTGTENGTAFSPTANAGTGIWDGNWHHVAGTFNGSQVRLFVDGAEVGTAQPASMTYATTTDHLNVGALNEDATFGFIGDIDEVRVWSRVLTPAEIAARASRSDFLPIALDVIIGPTGTDADAVDGPGNEVNLVATALDGGPTTLAAGPSPPTFDFNTYQAVDRTTGFDRSDLLAIRANQKWDGSPLLLDLDNDGSFADEVGEQGFGPHANRFVTFDLIAIRTNSDLPANQSFILTGVAGPANALPTNGMSLAVLVDGVVSVMHDVAAGASTSLPFVVPVTGSARYLTFIALEGPGVIEPNFDHGGFAQVMLVH